MDFTNLRKIAFEDLIPGNKYYIQKIKFNEKDPGTDQQYGIMNGYEIINDEKIYAVFNNIYDFKNPHTNEYMNSGMGTGEHCAYRSKYWFIFYEPKQATYNTQQNELLGKVVEQFTNDKYMGEYISKQCWLGIKNER
jgi:hypothetical protein